MGERGKQSFCPKKVFPVPQKTDPLLLKTTQTHNHTQIQSTLEDWTMSISAQHQLQCILEVGKVQKQVTLVAVPAAQRMDMDAPGAGSGTSSILLHQRAPLDGKNYVVRLFVKWDRVQERA